MATSDSRREVRAWHGIPRLEAGRSAPGVTRDDRPDPMGPLIDDLVAEQHALDAARAGVPDAHWERPSPAEGWLLRGGTVYNAADAGGWYGGASTGLGQSLGSYGIGGACPLRDALVTVRTRSRVPDANCEGGFCYGTHPTSHPTPSRPRSRKVGYTLGAVVVAMIIIGVTTTPSDAPPSPTMPTAAAPASEPAALPEPDPEPEEPERIPTVEEPTVAVEEVRWKWNLDRRGNLQG